MMSKKLELVEPVQQKTCSVEQKHNSNSRVEYMILLSGYRVSNSIPTFLQVSSCFHAGILLVLFDPEDESNMFLRNVS
jgi:hypothetical protein